MGPVNSLTANVPLGVASVAKAYNLNGNYNQSISISGLTGGNTELSQVTAGILIFDGVHAYMAVVYDNSNYDANVGIQCLPNDSSCSMGNVGDGTYALNFSNGDSISIKNNGTTGTNFEDDSNPWYWITPNYAVLPQPYNNTGA